MRTVITEADITRQAEDTPPLDNWVLYTRLGGNGTFRVGPGDPPEGVGSLELVTPNPAGLDKVTLFNFDYHATPIANFTALEYHTYQSSALVPIQTLTQSHHRHEWRRFRRWRLRHAGVRAGV